jgi:hypothetical protein
MRQSLFIFSSLFSTLLTLASVGCDGSIGGEPSKDDSGAGDDLDGDGYSGADDCDDGNADVHIDAIEVCDGIDNDCDARIDGNDDSLSGGTTYYPDADSDGFGDDAAGVLSCEAIAGYVEAGGDCDDAKAEVNPDGVESCSTGDDDDCDGDINDDGAEGCLDFYADADSDGYAETGATVGACLCYGTDDFPTQETGDCDDGDSTVSPGAEEICSDGVDQDCDGDWDECRLTEPGPVDAVAVAIEGIVDEAMLSDVMTAGPDLDGDGTADIALSVPATQQAFIYTTAPSSSTTVLTADITVNAASEGTLDTVYLMHDITGDGTGDLVGLGTASFTGDPQLIVWNAPAGTVNASDAELLLTDTSLSGTLPDEAFSLAFQSATADLFTISYGTGSISFFAATATGEQSLSAYRYGTLSTPGITGATALPDIDGDGYEDLAIHMGAGTGSVDILLSDEVATASGTSDASWSFSGEDGNDAFGGAVSGTGDINDDGYEDFLITAPFHDDTATNTGSVYLFLGSADSSRSENGGDAVAEFAGELRNNYAGTAAAGAGDLDLDGNLDIVIGAPGFDFGDMDNPGAAYAAYGPFSGYTSLNDLRSRVGGTNTEAVLGSTLSGPADLDNDGYMDMIVGSPGHDTVADTAAGALWIIYGAGL